MKKILRYNPAKRVIEAAKRTDEDAGCVDTNTSEDSPSGCMLAVVRLSSLASAVVAWPADSAAALRVDFVGADKDDIGPQFCLPRSPVVVTFAMLVGVVVFPAPSKLLVAPGTIVVGDVGFRLPLLPPTSNSALGPLDTVVIGTALNFCIDGTRFSNLSGSAELVAVIGGCVDDVVEAIATIELVP